MNKIYFLLLILLLGFLIPLKYSYAISPGVTCTDDEAGCTVNFDHTFIDSNNIYPNWSSTKTIRAVNNYPADKKFGLFITNIAGWGQPSPFEDVINVKIMEPGSSVSIWSGKLSGLSSNSTSPTLLSLVTAGSYKDYEFEFSMDNVGNEYQNRSIDFDMSFGFDDSVVVTATPENPIVKYIHQVFHSDKPKNTTAPTVAGASTQQVNAFASLLSSAPEIESASQDNIAPLVDATSVPQVAGAQTCKDPWWWFLLFILQVIILYLIFRKGTKASNLNRKLVTYATQTLITVIFVYIFWKFFCPTWDFKLSALIGLTTIILSFLKFKKSLFNSFK